MIRVNFDKNTVVNLASSLSREVLSVGCKGAYASTTIVGCNTRKYHGALLAPQPQIDSDLHVLLSSMEENVIQQGKEFRLGGKMYPGGVFEPKGYKYITSLELMPHPKFTYKVGGVILTKEVFVSTSQVRVIFKYTLENAQSETLLSFHPFLAFRNEHKLSKANSFANTQCQVIPNGVKCRLYDQYSDLYIQISKENSFVEAPDWYYNVEYVNELDRGYEGHEDLFIPGRFQVEIKKGECVYVTAGLDELANPAKLKSIFEKETASSFQLDSLESCLTYAAKQFIVKNGDRTEVVAGYPWFGRWGRDTFIALPGLTLSTHQPKVCKAVIDTMLSELSGPLFPNLGSGDQSAYNSVDAPLWFFWALQQYAIYTKTQSKIWKMYGEKMKLILEGYKNGTSYGIRMMDNGLIYAGCEGKALTWMDAVVNGNPITPRIGMPVEINALWYNAVCFSLEVAKLAKDKKFEEEWTPISETLPSVFKAVFWDKNKAYLADVVDGNIKDFSMRPNQIIAASLPYSPLSDKIKHLIVDRVGQELLTPVGVRTLSPMDSRYKGVYKGNQEERDKAYHQGIVWVWLLGHYVEAYLKIYGKKGVVVAERIYAQFSGVLENACVGSISEIYDADPPYKARGAVSQAWSVAEVLRIKTLINEYSIK